MRLMAQNGGEQATITVAVVGAGIAGLAAAKTLVSRGQGRTKVLVFEARERVGGRIHSVSTSAGGDDTVDTGASWVHGPHCRGKFKNPICALLQKHNLEFANCPLMGEDGARTGVFDGDQWWADTDVNSALQRVDQLVEEACEEAGGQDSVLSSVDKQFAASLAAAAPYVPFGEQCRESSRRHIREQLPSASRTRGSHGLEA